MTEWTAIVIAPPEPDDGPMVSRLPSYLHPVAGRPLIWHTVRTLATGNDKPDSILVSGSPAIVSELFEGVGQEVELVSPAASIGADWTAQSADGRVPIVVHASALIDHDSLRRLLAGETGDWIGPDESTAAALRVAAGDLERLLDQAEPFAVTGGFLDPLRRMPESPGTFVVRTRTELARAHQRIRDELVNALMRGGTSFILPDSVTVDVDVRIGRDTVVYPGVVIEGQTTIGDETVIGPGCRIIDSWVGSGVELKGWNYIAHTSIRNRAILEPNVRRGFD